MKNDRLKKISLFIFLISILYGSISFCAYKTRTRSYFGIGIGSAGNVGFGLEGEVNFGWELGKRVSLDLQVGGGSAQERSGIGGGFIHGEVLLPVTINICRSVPRVCPGLELAISPTLGVGYGWFDGIHALNIITGVSLESLRRQGKIDLGVKAGVYSYLNLLDFDNILSLLILNLGVVIRWGGD